MHWALGLTTLKGDRAQLWPPPATTTELCADPRVDPFPQRFLFVARASCRMSETKVERSYNSQNYQKKAKPREL